MGLKRLAILGSTGSIGVSALEVVEALPGRYQVASLAAHSSVEALAAQCARHRPDLAVVGDAGAAGRLRGLLPAGCPTRVAHGPAAYAEAAVGVGADMVLSAMVGAAGLEPTLAAVRAGIDVALANKETLVAGGEVVMAAAKASGARLLPVDSEHSALFQSLLAGQPGEVRHLWLTASGGPFRDTPAGELAAVTPERALDHPNWSMGPKITIDSATLMNKGLEVIEAHWLFGQPYDNIRVVIHPQSIVHSLVEFVDGNFMAQLGPPDMRLPIAYALGHPERPPLDLPTLDLTALGGLNFREPDTARFPALALAYAAGRAGGAAPAVLNAANEVAVAAFLAGRLEFLGIARCAEAVLEGQDPGGAASLEEVLEADRQARRAAEAWLARHGA